MTAFAHSLDRSIVIDATPEIVFGYFMDSARWAAWWGTGSSMIDRISRDGRCLMIARRDCAFDCRDDARGQYYELTLPKQ